MTPARDAGTRPPYRRDRGGPASAPVAVGAARGRAGRQGDGESFATARGLASAFRSCAGGAGPVGRCPVDEKQRPTARAAGYAAGAAGRWLALLFGGGPSGPRR